MEYYPVGMLIKQLRKQRGITQEELCGGGKDRVYLSRIEAGRRMPSKEYLDHVINKLGYATSQFITLLVSDTSSEALAMRKELDLLMSNGDYENTAELLAKMESHKEFKSGLNRQYLLKFMGFDSLYKKKNPVEALAHFHEAINISIPSFDEEKIHTYLLAKDEIELINSYAVAYDHDGLSDKAIMMLEKLIESVKAHYVDARERALSLVFAMHSLSYFLRKKDLFNEAIKICDEAILEGQRNQVYAMLPKLLHNKAYCLYKLGLHDDVKHLLLQSYYTSLAHGYKGCCASRILAQAKEIFDIDLI